MRLTGHVPPLMILSKDKESGIPEGSPVELDRVDPPSEPDESRLLGESIRRGRR